MRLSQRSLSLASSLSLIFLVSRKSSLILPCLSSSNAATGRGLSRLWVTPWPNLRLRTRLRMISRRRSLLWNGWLRRRWPPGRCAKTSKLKQLDCSLSRNGTHASQLASIQGVEAHYSIGGSLPVYAYSEFVISKVTYLRWDCVSDLTPSDGPSILDIFIFTLILLPIVRTILCVLF